jgi:hypothetical protein
MAGSYGQCPQCQTRLWIPAQASEENAESTALPARLGPAALAMSNQENGQQTKVARFLSAEAALSSLKLADDGALPELQLRESTMVSPVTPRAGINPLVTISLLCLSAVASVAMLFMPDDPEQSARTAKKQWVRAALEKEYYAEMDGLPRYPYQFQLREAERAHVRGDYGQERDSYRKILEWLRAERKPESGVTGSPGRDRELEEYLTILLSN